MKRLLFWKQVLNFEAKVLYTTLKNNSPKNINFANLKDKKEKIEGLERGVFIGIKKNIQFEFLLFFLLFILIQLPFFM